MATTTPQFGWSVPTSTDYVKDGASAIETLGDAIDARFGNAATYPNQIVNVVSGVSRPVAFAMAQDALSISTTSAIGAGPWSGGYYGTASVTMPTSRFTQAPMVTATTNEGSAGTGFVNVVSRSTTSITFIGINQLSGSNTIYWQAIQMTSASAAG